MSAGELVAPYARLLRLPHIPRLVFCGLLATMPAGMSPLALLLLARDATGSYGQASIVVAGTAIGTATISPLRGKAVDRRGAARVLPGFALAYAGAVGAVIAAAELNAPTAVLALLAFAYGGLAPPVGATLRTLIADGVPSDGQQAAFGLLTLMSEASYLTGPIIVAALVTVGSPGVALAVMAALVTIGTLGFATSPTTRRLGGSEAEPGRFAVLASPAMRVVLASVLLWGVTFGGLDVSLPAFADERGSAATGGVLLTVLSAGVALGTFVYGSRQSARPVERRLVLATAVGAATFAPLALATEVWQLALLVLVTGIGVAAPTVCIWLALAQAAPERAKTEAATWITSAGSVGIAIGATVVGAVVDAFDARAAFLAAFASASIGVVVVLAGEGRLRPAVAA
jgi:MFS family permease